MHKEYDMLRAEMMDKSKKQESLNGIFFSLLGLSCVYSTIYENLAFIVLILFVSAVLLAQMQQCRNEVYYLSTYLMKMQASTYEEGIVWEYRLQRFQEKVRTNRPKWKIRSRISLFFVWCATGLKYFSNLALTAFLVYRFVILISNEMLTVYETTGSYVNAPILVACILAAGSCLLNVLFTISICFDISLKSAYTKTWESVLEEKTLVASDEKEPATPV